MNLGGLPASLRGVSPRETARYRFYLYSQLCIREYHYQLGHYIPHNMLSGSMMSALNLMVIAYTVNIVPTGKGC